MHKTTKRNKKETIKQHKTKHKEITTTLQLPIMTQPKRISNAARHGNIWLCLSFCLFSAFRLSASVPDNDKHWLNQLKTTVDQWSADWEKQNPKPSGNHAETLRKRNEKYDRDYRNFLSETFLNFRHNLYPSCSEDIALEQENRIWDGYTPRKGYAYLYGQYADRTASELRSDFQETDSITGLLQRREAFRLTRQMKDLALQLRLKQPEALRNVIRHMEEVLKAEIPEKNAYLNAVTRLEQRKRAWLDALDRGNVTIYKEVKQTLDLLDKTLLDNPLLATERLLYLRREIKDARNKFPELMGFPSLNSHTNTNIINSGANWYNEIGILTDLDGKRSQQTLFRPEKPVLISDLEISFDASKVLFSSIGTHDCWHVFEQKIDGGTAEQLTSKELPDINHFDACYLPDGNIIYTADATYQGLPCEGGSRPMALLYLYDRKTGETRQLTYEQDSDWCPTVLNNGKVMYLRWEYSDISHYFSRILMTMNPDGTSQMEYYGSNSYFPNSYFYARAIPEHPTKVVGIVGGHHGISRSGRLMIIDPQLGRREADGVVQEIPYRGKKVEPIVKDMLIDGVFPQFLHPYPLSEDYFLVSAKMSPESLWGLYLVDTYNNMTLIKQEEGAAYFDPILLKPQPTPPVIASKIDPDSDQANVFLSDIYAGEGLKGVPRGTVKKLRLFSYHFAHMGSGGHNTVGIESGWDIKRILGTVDVEADGSAFFTVPANTPIAVQPLDSNGCALQLMRSWFVGMPGETVSCVGCHEQQSTVVANKYTLASRKKPAPITEWYGKARPFSFRYEIQPILDRKCLGCHNGEKPGRPDFRKQDTVRYEGYSNTDALFFNETGYLNLHPYVYRPGPESDNRVAYPLEYHASVSELVQLLQRGHYNVTLDREEWEKLYAWIDLNVPYRGKWSPPEFRNFDQDSRRKELTERYARVKTDPEAEFDELVARFEKQKIEPVMPAPLSSTDPTAIPSVKGWPFSAEEAIAKQKAEGETGKTIDLGGVRLELVRIPAGEYVSGSDTGYDDERQRKIVKIDRPFWMAKYEISNEIYELFDPSHDSRYIDQHWKDHINAGYPAHGANQPAIRISYEEAEAFCKWLSEKTGLKCSLPSEEQWEWACRAGSDKPFWFGETDSDFSAYENLSDRSVRKFVVDWNGAGNHLRYRGDNDPMMKYYDFIPRSQTIDDGNMIVCDVTEYQPNPWGLHNMHGNVAEWCSGSYQPGANDIADRFYTGDMKVARGGSWRDRPQRASASARRFFNNYQKPFLVGFRIIVTD